MTTEELALHGVCAAPDAAVAVLSPLVAETVHRTVARPPRATDYDDLIQEGLLRALPEVEKVTPKIGEDLDGYMRRFHRRIYLVVSHRMIDLLRHEARRHRQKVGDLWVATDVMSLEHAKEAGVDILDPTADVDLVADQELIQELSERYRAVACAAWRSLPSSPAGGLRCSCCPTRTAGGRGGSGSNKTPPSKRPGRRCRPTTGRR